MSPNFGYSVSGLDPDKTAKASGRFIRCSPKSAREVCNTIKGMLLEKAKEYLMRVILKRQAVPFKRHKKHLAHRKGLQKWASGRYPVKAAYYILSVIENAEANAEYKGLDIELCRIIHSATHRGRIIKRYIQRAHGRSTAKYHHLSHVEIVIYEFPS